MAGMKNQLRYREVLLVLTMAQNHRVVFFDEPRKVFPGWAIRVGELDMATPEPRTLLRKMVNQGQWLGIVHYDHVVVDAVPNGVFEIHLFENARLYFRKVNVGALQSVVHFLRDVEEIRSSLDKRHSAFIPRLFINSVIPQ